MEKKDMALARYFEEDERYADLGHFCSDLHEVFGFLQNLRKCLRTPMM